MPRNMSFKLTTQQFKDRTKTVPRRCGWWFLKPGDILCGVEKGMGLKRGEKIKRLGLIRVVSIRKEILQSITGSDVIKEGFPEMTRGDFIQFFIEKSNPKLGAFTEVNRIEFEYIEGGP